MIACKDCKFAVPVEFGGGAWSLLAKMFANDERWRYAKCELTKKTKKTIEYSIGNIKSETVMAYCDIERGHGDCGPEAKNFQPR